CKCGTILQGGSLLLTRNNPYLINDMLNVHALRVDYTCVVDMQKARHLLLVIPYMVGVQNNNASALMRH
ncbi:hypothetical protein MKW98_023115, partial [Papaver atlanticum]